MAQLQSTAAPKPAQTKNALPPVSPAYYHNCLLTLGLSQTPFDAEIYGAIEGVIHFRALAPIARKALTEAIGRAATSATAKLLADTSRLHNEATQPAESKRLWNNNRRLVDVPSKGNFGIPVGAHNG